MQRARAGAMVVGIVLLLALVALVAASPIFAIDFFWHLKLGELMRQSGALVRTDTFSAVHPERPYVQFNWLWELLASYVQAGFGLRGIRVMQSLLLTASFGLLLLCVRRALAHTGLALVVCALALVLFEDRFQARPSALALGFFAATLPLLTTCARPGDRRRIAYAALLGFVWSSVHGGESVLLVLSLGALLAGELGHRYLLGRPDAQSSVRASALLLIAAAIGFVASPTSIDGWSHWLAAVQPQLATGNREWMTTWRVLQDELRPASVVIGLAPSLVTLAYIAEQLRCVRARGAAAIDLREWLLCAGYLALSQHAVRNAFLCILPLVFMLQRRAPQLASARAQSVQLALAALLLALSFDDAIVRGYGGLERVPVLIAGDLAPGAQPEQLADFMHEAGLEGRVINDGRWGGYLIWRTWPACSVLSDSRHDFTQETWPLFLSSHEPLQRPRALDEGFERYGLELAIFEGPVFPLHLPSPDWVLLFKAGEQELFQHVRGEHAALNLARARAWLARHGEVVPEDAPLYLLSATATKIGAARWLEAPMQRLRLTDASDAERGALYWQAGLYGEAIAALERAIERAPDDVKPRYHAALSLFALSQLERARDHLVVLALHQTELTAAQRARLQMLSRAVSGPASR